MNLLAKIVVYVSFNSKKRKTTAVIYMGQFFFSRLCVGQQFLRGFHFFSAIEIFDLVCNSFFKVAPFFSFFILDICFFRVDYSGIFKNVYVIFFSFRFVLSNLRCTLVRTFTFQEDWYYLLQWKPLEMMNTFYFTLKAIFVLKIFIFLSWLSRLFRKTA